MKKIIFKNLSLVLLTVVIVSCSNSGEDLKYNPDVERGWIQFVEETSNSPILSPISVFQGAEGTIDLPVNIQVPTTSEDLVINYEMVSVSGPNPGSIFSNNGRVIAPAGNTSYGGPDNNTGSEYVYLANITLDLGELANAATLSETMVFDVVLSGTSSDIIGVGLNNQFPTSQRIIVNPSLDGFVGTYTVAEQFTGPPNAPNGLGFFFNETYQVELARMSGDASASKFVVTNSAGFDSYFIDGAELTFEGDGSLTFDDGNSEDGFPVVALFRIFEYTSSSYDYDNLVLQADGPLSTFGEYQFVLTRQ